MNSILRTGQTLAAVVGTPVESGDSILTGPDGAIGITLRDQTLISAGPNSTLELKRFAFNPNTHDGELKLTVKRGSLAAISGKLAKSHPEAVRFSTDTITLGVRGTVFLLGAADAPDATHEAGYWRDGSGQALGTADQRRVCNSTGAAWGGCQPNHGRAVLLPDANGHAGAVWIETRDGQQLLDQAYASTTITADGGLLVGHESKASLQQQFGAALQAQAQPPLTFVLRFLPDSATELSAASIAVLQQVKAALAARPAADISLIGHTDTVGSDEVNDALSLARATTVKDIITARGFKPESIEIAGRGARELLVASGKDVPDERNRRVEITIR